MKYKLIIRILGLALAVCSVICIFTACDNSDLRPSDSETNQKQNINDNGGDDNPTQDHTHVYNETVVNPTCTEKGYTLHKCSCGAEYRTDETNETGHDYGDWIETVAPTCTEEGEMQRVCRKDPTHKETMTITPTGHKFSSEWTYDSVYHYHASTCGHNVVSDRNTHDFKTDIINVTCDTDGYSLHTCKTCGYFYTDNICFIKLIMII